MPHLANIWNDRQDRRCWPNIRLKYIGINESIREVIQDNDYI